MSAHARMYLSFSGASLTPFGKRFGRVSVTVVVAMMAMGFFFFSPTRRYLFGGYRGCGEHFLEFLRNSRRLSLGGGIIRGCQAIWLRSIFLDSSSLRESVLLQLLTSKPPNSYPTPLRQSILHISVETPHRRSQCRLSVVRSLLASSKPSVRGDMPPQLHPTHQPTAT